MATRINAKDEKLATLRSIMNVIAVLDQDHPPRAVQDRAIDIRGLIDSGTQGTDEPWPLEWLHLSHRPVPPES